MDAVTIAINNMNNPLLTQLSVFLDNSLYFLLLVFVLLLIFERNDKKRTKLMAAIFLALVFSSLIKIAIGTPRPCEELNLRTDCSQGYSFPSNHTIVAFTLALGFLDNKKFVLFLIFAVFIAITRIYLGVHTFLDVTASMTLSPIVYEIVDYYWRRIK
ncbi:MAG: phosphatase PAP2 family protein [Candidatus ainarchaeum sp.]|nr:phosphatase PAP2 family protein [Candidatus ainarchaeum sp.]